MVRAGSSLRTERKLAYVCPQMTFNNQLYHLIFVVLQIEETMGGNPFYQAFCVVEFHIVEGV